MKYEKSILIVDDSLDVQNQVKVFLGSVGLTSLYFADSVAAVYEILGITKKGAPNTTIVLILMDIKMPGANGIEATKAIKAVQDFQDVPVLMVTGDNSEESLKAAFEAGAVDYITKPLKKVELVTRVQSFLKLKEEIDARKKREKELEEALTEIKELREMLPLCSFCKKIRDDEGYWEQVDVYIHKHLQADISHSICPECLEVHYPELDICKLKN